MSEDDIEVVEPGEGEEVEAVVNDGVIESFLSEDGVQVVVPVEHREFSTFLTESGTINVIHEITLGDLVVSTLILAFLTFTVMSRFVGGKRHV